MLEPALTGAVHSGNLTPCPGKPHKARRCLHARGLARVCGNWRSPGLQQGSEGPAAGPEAAVGPEAAAGTRTQRCSTWKLCGVGVAKRSRAEQSLERLHRKTTRVSRSLHLHGPEQAPTKATETLENHGSLPWEPLNPQQSLFGAIGD